MPPGRVARISHDAWLPASERSGNTLKIFQGLLPENQNQNLALTVLYVPYSLDLEGAGAARAVGEHVRDVVIVHQVLSLEPPVEKKKVAKLENMLPSQEGLKPWPTSGLDRVICATFNVSIPLATVPSCKATVQSGPTSQIREESGQRGESTGKMQRKASMREKTDMR